MPTKKQLDEAAEASKQVDWAKLDAMTDEEIEAAALSDPDNPPLTDARHRSPAQKADRRRVTSAVLSPHR